MSLKLSYPVNNPIISQFFGANPELYSNEKYGGIKGHNGIDFVTQHGTPIYASHDGLASYQIDNGGGHGIVITTNEPIDGNYYKTIYWHLVDGLKEPHLKSPLEGKTGFTLVKNGELIGYANNTGMSTGDHLHFGLKTIEKGEDWGTWYNTNQNNGYNGAIDPQPFFDGSTPAKIHILEKQVNLFTQIVELYKQLKLKLAR